jgi:hypothetical protein
MSLEKHIETVFTVYKPKRGWKVIYWMVDVHGVIIRGTWHKKNHFEFIDETAKDVLKWISDRPDQKLILWTSSKPEELEAMSAWLLSHGIVVDFMNSNPDEKDTEYADFSLKPYFNILLDDKAGFDPETDWQVIKDTLVSLGLWAPLSEQIYAVK